MPGASTVVASPSNSSRMVARRLQRGHVPLRVAGKVRAGGVFFATPCHQHPFHSHAHLPSRVPVPMAFLECQPAAVEGRNEHEPDEADRFFADPETFLDRRFESGDGADERLPSHVVLFDGTSRDAGMRRWLDKWGFEVHERLFHAHFAVDRELQAEVLVFARPAAKALTRQLPL